MKQQPGHRYSIFSQSLDAATFVGYFLGAIVPLLALAYVAHVYVLPGLEDRVVAKGLVALILCIGALSLASYLVLRKITRQNMARIEGDNLRLGAILEAARALSTAPHRADAAHTIATCAQELTNARAAFVLHCEKTGEDAELNYLGRAGAGSAGLPESHKQALDEAAALSIQFDRVVVRGPGGDENTAGLPLCCVPIVCATGAAAIAILGERVAPNAREIDALSTLAALGAVALRSSDLQDIQRNFFVQMTDLLVTALDQHLDYHEGHARRVAHITNRLGRELKLDDQHLERLHFASLLHDLGMLKIPIEKHGEKKFARTHPVIGHRMLIAIRVWEDLAPFVLHHHEWYNGEGYPEGLAGEDIPFEARIIGLAEAVDSMISQTSYKEAVSTEEMLRRVQAGSGTQFDPHMTRVFLDLVERDQISL
jgi:hypothetical protein